NETYDAFEVDGGRVDRRGGSDLDAMALRRSRLYQVPPGARDLYCYSRDHYSGSTLVVDALDWRADRPAGHLGLVRSATRGNSSSDSSRFRRQVRRRDMDWLDTSNRRACGDRCRWPGCDCSE